MGGDGGSIPRRCDQVKEKPREVKVDRATLVDIQWRQCALSQEPLHEPVVACEVGLLYNKEAVLLKLLAKQMPPAFSHIRSIKDVKACRLTRNTANSSNGYEQTGGANGLGNSEGPSSSVTVSSSGMFAADAAPFMCPITLVEANGHHRFCLIWTCGCVLSERALREVQSSACHVCGKPFSAANDVVALTPLPDEVPSLREALLAKRRKAKEARDTVSKESKDGKRTASAAALGSSASHSDAPAASASSASSAAVVSGEVDPATKKVKLVPGDGGSASTPAASAALSSLSAHGGSHTDDKGIASGSSVVTKPLPVPAVGQSVLVKQAAAKSAVFQSIFRK